jgi:hypothetical protein
MSTCRYCGAENADEATLCAQCGRVLTVPPPQVLAQIQGVLPAEPVILRGRLPSGDEALWQALVTAVMASSPPPPPPAAVGSATRIGLGLLMVVVILITAVLSAMGWRAELSPAPPRPGVAAAYHLIAVLPSTARVLLAWDYDPTTQGEMQLLARPLLRHLLSRRVVLVNVSLRPLGPAMAAAAFAGLETVVPLAQAPVDLGFLPGESAALQALALAPAGVAPLSPAARDRLALAGDEPITAFDLIIEFSAETATSRQWVEQIAARQPVPLIVAASGAVAPALEPYAQTGQIVALLSGYPDALAYEALLGSPGTATARQMAQNAVLLLVVAVVIAALIRSLRRRPSP